MQTLALLLLVNCSNTWSTSRYLQDAVMQTHACAAPKVCTMMQGSKQQAQALKLVAHPNQVFHAAGYFFFSATQEV